MAGINKAILLGRLGKDPEVRDASREKRVCNLSIATSKKIRGEEKTEWHRVTVWSENSIDYLQQYAERGSMVYIEGEIETRKYQKDGRDVYTTEIICGQFGSVVQIVTDFKEREERESRSERNERAAKKGGKKTYREESNGDDRDMRTDAERELDDEIPF